MREERRRRLSSQRGQVLFGSGFGGMTATHRLAGFAVLAGRPAGAGDALRGSGLGVRLRTLPAQGSRSDVSGECEHLRSPVFIEA